MEELSIEVVDLRVLRWGEGDVSAVYAPVVPGKPPLLLKISSTKCSASALHASHLMKSVWFCWNWPVIEVTVIEEQTSLRAGIEMKVNRTVPGLIPDLLSDLFCGSILND